MLLLAKGLYVRAPYIEMPDKVEYIKKQSFLGSLMGQQRPLLAVEITNIYANVQTFALGKALLTAFSQVAKSKAVRQFFVRGRDIAAKHIEVLDTALHDSQLRSPMTWNDTVTDSVLAPFSDKLMMFHVAAIAAVGVTDYGASLSTCLRKDLALTYTRLAAEIGQYAEDGANLMIEQSWMEQPPQTVDRDALARV